MDSDSAKTRFLTAIGHDMRQPLHALLLYLSALDRRIQDSEARDILGKADRAAQSLAGMIEGLIQLARLDADKIEPELERVSLQELFNELMTGAPHASADTTELFVHSDPVLLATIMQQLVANAGKHGGGGAHLSAAEKDGAVEIKVRDKGPGISAEDQERIFAEFVRLEGGGNTGLGVGLTIASKLAALMSHKIEVQSKLGDGATFIVHAKRA